MINLNDYIENNPNIFRQYKVDDMLFVEYICLAEDEITNFWAHNHFFIYTLKGKKGIKAPDNEYYINAGDAVFIKKGAQTTLQFFEEQFYALIIFLPDEFIKSVMQEHQIKGYVSENGADQTVFALEMDDVLSTFFYSVLSYFSRPKGPSRQLLKNKFEELIINLLSGPNNQHIASYFNFLYANSKTSLCDVMEANFYYRLKLEEFARLSGRSISTFRRDFEKIYGTTPSKWLTNRRLDYGKYLLETTDKSINEITFDIGFENPSHFIRIFKEKFNTSPLRFKHSGEFYLKNPV